MTVGHNPPVSGVAAFGFQDLGFRTSINGHCFLLLLLSSCFYNASVVAFGSQDLGFSTSLACVSPPPRPAAPKCNRGRFCHKKCRDRFCHRIVVSDRIVVSNRQIDYVNLLQHYNLPTFHSYLPDRHRFYHRKYSTPVLPVN